MEENALDLLSQEWLDSRFAQVRPEDFELTVHFCSCSARSRAPRGFEHVWSIYDGASANLLAGLETWADLDVLVVLCNPIEESLLLAFLKLLPALKERSDLAGFILWAPHTTMPEVGFHAGDDIAELGTELLKLDLDAFLADEPTGLDFAFEVQKQVRRLEIRATEWAKVRQRSQQLAKDAESLQRRLDLLLWDYCRPMFAKAIPAIDTDIPAGDVQSVCGLQVGPLLGRGNCGYVRILAPGGDSEIGPAKVMKAVAKQQMQQVADLIRMNRDISIMEMLSEKWAHPNIARFYDVLHTPSHILLILEYAGPLNLYRLLKKRDLPADTRQPLCLGKAVSLLKQMISAVGHLHLGPGICHRDLKPENLVVGEHGDGSCVLKVVDFETSVIQQPGRLSFSMVGTIPFTDPEVIMARGYCGFAADLWSMGIIMLEVLCFNRVVERVIGADQQSFLGPSPELAGRIYQAFASPRVITNVLKRFGCPELGPLRIAALPLLTGILNVEVSQRWNTHQAVTACDALAA